MTSTSVHSRTEYGTISGYIWPRAGWRTCSVDASRHSVFHPATKLAFIVKASVSNKDRIKVLAEVSRSALFNPDVLQLADHFRTWNCKAFDPANHATINFHRLNQTRRFLIHKIGSLRGSSSLLAPWAGEG